MMIKYSKRDKEMLIEGVVVQNGRRIIGRNKSFWVELGWE